MKTKIITIVMLVFIYTISITSALVISDVNQNNLYPGKNADISVKVKNTLNNDVEDVSLKLVLENTPFITIGGSVDTEDYINNDDSETFSYKLKASQDAKPGDYNIPYILEYFDKNGTKMQNDGSIGVEVDAETKLDYEVKTENNIVGQKGQISLEIRNIGFGDAKFVSVKINPKGYILLSENSDYIGTVSSDDFETATFNVLFTNKNTILEAVVSYKDFNNNEIEKTISMPVKVYTHEEAIDLGIIQKSYTLIYLSIIIILFLIWFVYRKIKKSKKRKKEA